MGPIKNILFPVDFSESCFAMSAYVKRAAALLGAKVSLIHVFDPSSYNGFEIYVRRVPEIADEHQDIALRRLEGFLADDFPPPECRRMVVAGDAAAEIAAAAKEGFDMIIMPTHAGSFRRMLLGSTTAKVLNDADCPVLTSRHAETIAPHPLDHREWLCAIDLSADSERVLGFANQLATQARGRLHILHAIQAPDRILPVKLDIQEQVQTGQERQAIERIAELQKKIGSQATVRVAHGAIKDALLEAAREYEADALLIGRSPQSGADGRLRDLTYTIVRDSPFPVMSV
ncbi:MAG TPA: universal stress protein [Verrucomicrobiae bacterium]|nr:universal stress protein [Verrucomicrobiae bacterium]